MPDIVARGDEVCLPCNGNQPRGEQQISDDDGEHEQDGDGPLKTDAVRLARVAEHGIATVLGRVQCQQQDHETHGSSRQIEIHHAVTLSAHASKPANADHRHQIESDQQQGTRAKAQSRNVHQSVPSSQKRYMTKAVHAAKASVAARLTAAHAGRPRTSGPRYPSGQYHGIATA